MSESEQNSLGNYFGDMPDPRVMGRCEHKLVDIIVTAICAVLSGAEGWEDIEEFGQSKRDWLKQFLALPNGIMEYRRTTRFGGCLAYWMRVHFKSVLCAGWKGKGCSA